MSTSIHYPAHSNKSVHVALWGLQILAAAGFLFFGSMKLTGAPMMVQCSMLLLTPALSSLGALLLVGTLIGAVMTHLLIIGGNPVPAIVLLVITSIIAWGPRGQLLRLLGKRY